MTLSPHATTFGALMESDPYLELVEEGAVDEVEGGAIKAEPAEWNPPVVSFGAMKLSRSEMKALRTLEWLEAIDDELGWEEA